MMQMIPHASPYSHFMRTRSILYTYRSKYTGNVHIVYRRRRIRTEVVVLVVVVEEEEEEGRRR